MQKINKGQFELMLETAKEMYKVKEDVDVSSAQKMCTKKV